MQKVGVWITVYVLIRYVVRYYTFSILFLVDIIYCKNQLNRTFLFDYTFFSSIGFFSKSF